MLKLPQIIFFTNFLSYVSAKYYLNRVTVGQVSTTIKGLTFYRETV